jgi:hypothetical protein
MTTVSNVKSPKEVPLAGGASLVAGTMLVNGDTNGVIVVPANMTAAALVTLLGISSNLKTIDLGARSGAFPDSGKPIFDV